MRASRRWWAVAVAGGLVAVLAACGTDLARSSGPRSTVPAAEGLAGPATTGTPQPGGGDAFSAASLRRVNPCGLLDEEVLAQFGTPARSRLRDFGLCSNYMKDPAGRDLNFTLTVGDSSLARKPEGSLKVGGLPTAESELDDKSACFLTAITETNPSRGITIQLGSDTPGGLCDPARKVLESAVNEVRDAKPPLEVQKGSLVDLDPCTTLDDATITTAIGDGATKNPTSLHTCAYNNRGVALRLDFTISNDPDDLAEAAETTPVDLGGIRAQQKSEVRSSARCELSWAHVKFEGAEGTSEVVNLDFTRYQPQAGEDPCTTLQAVAKALIPKLPQT